MKQADRDKKKAWMVEQKKMAQDAFPLSDDLLASLFDFVGLSVGKDGCDHSRRLTRKWLDNNNVLQEPVLQWLESTGGFCDCEVVYNSMDHWEANR